MNVLQGLWVLQKIVETVPHLASFPDFQEQPELEFPSRDWTPFGMSALYTSVAAGAAILLENGGLNVGSRREVISIGAVVLIAGVVSSLRRPEPRTLEVGVQFNRLLRSTLQQRNAAIAQQNADLRRQVVITVKPAGGGSR